MLKLNSYFLFNYLAVIVLSVVIGGALFFFGLKEYEMNTIKQELTNYAKVIKNASKKEPNFERIAQTIYSQAKIRLTIIDKNGKVVFDNLKDPSLMDNHSLREEIKALNTQSYASSVRFSKTLQENFMYLATRLNASDKTVLRLSMSVQRINTRIVHLWLSLIAYVFIVLLIAVFVSFTTNKKIVKELRLILHATDDFSKKIYPVGIRKFFISDFAQIYSSLVFAGKKLNKFDRKKRKHAAQIRLKNKQQKDMLSSLSHEFKNPIAVISGYTQTLLNDKIDENLQQRFLEKIGNNANKLNNMLDRFSLAVRLESKNFELNMSNFSLNELIEEVIANTKLNGREIITDVIKIQVYADKDLMEIVIKNLLENALKYSDSTITIKLVDTHFEVIDQGLGVDENEVKNITKKFYTVSKLDWNNSMGLGLFIVSYILKLHKSKLDINSRLHHGSSFGFDISSLVG